MADAPTVPEFIPLDSAPAPAAAPAKSPAPEFIPVGPAPAPDFIPAKDLAPGQAQPLSEHLDALPRTEIEREFAQARRRGEDLTPYYESYRRKAESGNLSDDATPWGEWALAAPGKLANLGVSVAEGTFALANETAKLLGLNPFAARFASESEKAASPADMPIRMPAVSDEEAAQAPNNIASAAAINGLRAVGLLSNAVERVWNRVVVTPTRDAQGNEIKTWGSYTPEERAKIYDRQLERGAGRIDLEDKFRSGEVSIFHIPGAKQAVDPAIVEVVEKSPIVDPTMYLPAGVGFKAARGEASVAARALSAGEPAVSLSEHVLQQLPRSVGKGLVKAGEAAEKYPLIKAAGAAGIAVAAGGDAVQSGLAALFGANTKLNLLESSGGKLINLADRLAGKAPNGPMSRFAMSATKAFGDEATGLLASQLANTPFVLGAGDDDSARDMMLGGLLMHGAMKPAGAIVNGLDIGRNLWAERKTMPDTRLAVKDYGQDATLDQAHRKVVDSLNNSSANFVQAVRDYFGKERGEVYTLFPDDYNKAIDQLVADGHLDQSTANAAKQQQGVQVQIRGEDGETRQVALSKVSPSLPGLSVGHESGHLLERLLSPEELEHAYQEIYNTYGPEQIQRYKENYERLANAQGANVSLTTPQVVSEIFAEHVGAVLNSIPIEHFSDPKLRTKDLSRTIYSMVGRGLEKVGARVPQIFDFETRPETEATPTKIQPSAKLGNLIENVLQAHALDFSKTKYNTPSGKPPIREDQKTLSGGAKPAPKPETTVSAGPAHPISDQTQFGAQEAPGVERVIPPRQEGGSHTHEEQPADNVRTTEAKQNQFGEATEEQVQKTREHLDRAFTGPRPSIPALELDYLSAKSDTEGPNQIEREKQRQAADALEEASKAAGLPNPLRRAYQKVTVPYGWADPARKNLLHAMSMDKVIQNVDLLQGWLHLHPDARKVLDPQYLASPQLTRDVQTYLRNQSHGYAGDGRKLVRPEDTRVGSITPEDPNYSPTKLGEKEAQTINLLMGMEQPGKETPGQVFSRRFAEQNGIEVPQVRGVSDTNPLRARLRNEHGFDPRVLNAAVEILRTNRIRSFKERPDLDFKAGDTAMQRAGFMPRTDYDVAEDYGSRYDRSLDDIVGGFTASGHSPEWRPSWNKIPAARLKRIWLDYGKTGVLRDEKGMQKIADQTMDLIARLDAANGLAGHDNFDPIEGTEHVLTEPQRKALAGAMETKDGTWLVSDYGLPYLKKIYSQIFRAETPEQQLFAVDRALNVVHQRGDLASLFVEGGSKTLTEIANQGGYETPNKADWGFRRNEQMAGFMPETATRAQGNEETRGIAERYMRDQGIENEPHTGNRPIDEEFAKRVADHFEAAKHDPHNPEVKAAYDALARETMAQYRAMREAGIKIEPFEGRGEPYKNSAEMMRDVRDNKHLYFLRTENAYGTPGAQPLGTPENALLAPSGVKINGHPLLVNDVFRAVHDYFGHTAEGYEFGPRGEYNAYLAHSKMFSDEAKPALAAETLAQNAWVNFGRHLRRPDGSIPRRGDPDFRPLAERPFGEQKNFTVPRELLDEAESPRFMPETQQELGLEGEEPRLRSTILPTEPEPNAARDSLVGRIREARKTTGAFPRSYTGWLERTKNPPLPREEIARLDRLALAAREAAKTKPGDPGFSREYIDAIDAFSVAANAAADRLRDPVQEALAMWHKGDYAPVLARASTLRDFFGSLPAEKNATVYRGMKLDGFGSGEPLREIKSLQPGDKIRIDEGDPTSGNEWKRSRAKVGFVSTSSDPSVARRFSKRAKNGVFLSFQTDSARYVADALQAASGRRWKEYEHVLPVGTTFEITDIRRTNAYGRARTYVDLKEIPAESAPDAKPLFMPPTEERLEHAVPEDTLDLVHYGSSGMRRIDPKFFGRSGLTAKSELAGAPRSYFYEAGKENRHDPVLGRGSKYSTEVPGGRIYDGDKDPLGYNDQINRWKADQMLQDEGYIGIRRTAGSGRNKYSQVELFEPVRAAEEPVRRAASFLPDTSKNRKPEGAEEGTNASFMPHTPEFKRWFGDSKVVDEKGEPLVVYHGTASNFDVFHGGEDGAMYFTPDASLASWFAEGNAGRWEDDNHPNLVPAFLKISHPKVLSEHDLTELIGPPDDRSWESMPSVVAEAKREGYDGIYLKGVHETNNKGITDQWLAFEPSQIKSAIGNRGTFDPKNPDIRYLPDTTRIVSAAKRDNEVHRILMEESEARSGPFDGGCLIYAKALQHALGGGELVRLVNPEAGHTDHYGLQTPDGIADASGVYPDAGSWAKAFSKQERLDYPLEFAKGYDAESEIPDDPHAVKLLAKRLSSLGTAFMPKASLDDFKADTLEQALRRPGWTILTGTQERNGAPDSPANLAANAKLEAELQSRGLPYKVVGGSYNGVDQGKNFLVTGVSERTALALGKKYKQDSVLTNRGYLYQDGSVAPLVHKNTVVGEAAKEQPGFSVLPDGTPFSAGINWDKRVQPDPRETPQYRQIAKHLTPEEREGVRSDVAADMVKLFDALPPDVEFETAANLGLAKRGWYARAAKILREAFGPESDKFVSLLAATSPRQSVQDNLAMSLEVWEKWVEAGRPDDPAKIREIATPLVELDSRLNNTVRALRGQDLEDNPISASKRLDASTALSGHKVESFRRNLLGDLHASTNDSWMAQFAGIPQAQFGTKAGYLAFTAKVRRVADKLDLKPAEVQETIWSFFKTLVESTKGGKTAHETLANLTENDILQTPEFHDEIVHNPKVLEALKRLGVDEGRVRALADPEIAGKRAAASGRPLAAAAVEAGRGHSRVLARIADRAQAIKDAEGPAPEPEVPGENPF